MKVSTKDLFESNDPAILKSSAFQKLNKQQQRLIKNRLSADASRKRKKELYDELGSKVDALERENTVLKLQVDELLTKNQELQGMVLYLSSAMSTTMPPTLPISIPFNTTALAISRTDNGDNPLGIDLLAHQSPVPSTLNGSTLSNPSLSAGEENEDELANRMLADFVDFDQFETNETEGDQHGMLTTSFKSIFSMFLFTFAAFLVPASLHFHPQHAPLPSMLPILPSSFNLFSMVNRQIPLLPSSASPHDATQIPSSSLSQILRDDWHLQEVETQAVTSLLPLEPHSFLNSLAVLSKINPPNAIFGIEGLFRSNSLDVKLALVPTPSTAGVSQEFALDSSSCINQASLMVDPRIRIAPYTKLYSQDDEETQQQQKLRLSLFADISGQAGLGIRGDGGILRLDLQVFKATWLETKRSE